jgi:hypothetical protein
MGLMMMGWIVFTVYGLVGAVITFQGKNFRYFLIGKRVENFLSAA